jgi:hypothetical protein
VRTLYLDDTFRRLILRRIHIVKYVHHVWVRKKHPPVPVECIMTTRRDYGRVRVTSESKDGLRTKEDVETRV